MVTGITGEVNQRISALKGSCVFMEQEERSGCEIFYQGLGHHRGFQKLNEIIQ